MEHMKGWRSAMEHLLEVRDLRCGYGSGSRKTEIVHGVSFHVDAREFVCVIGANGCGKTTTLKSMMCLLALSPCAAWTEIGIVAIALKQ